MIFRMLSVLFVILLLALPATSLHAEGKATAGEAEHVVVQHILIGFKRSIPGKKVDLTKKEAKALAGEILERARKGEEFDALVKEYTNDTYPGIFLLANKGIPIRAGERKRSDMVQGFSDIAFSLEVGEIGMAPFHAYKSPYGWHIILRLE